MLAKRSRNVKVFAPSNLAMELLGPGRLETLRCLVYLMDCSADMILWGSRLVA